MNLLLTFYGDDFTGSSAVMEVLVFAGIPTVLFLDIPSPTILAKLGAVQAVGIAGIARSKSPDWMDEELPRFFNALKSLNAPVMHYKTCSTFDSAPDLGSIGRATEIGLTITEASWAPLIVGAPAIGRYQMFGTLFATHDSIAYRLDRHPVMARHPATPMKEADLCRHLDDQTDLRKAVVDWRALLSSSASATVQKVINDGAKIIALDAFDNATLAASGKVIWQQAQHKKVFAVGSQGIEYALVAHWREAGLLPAAKPSPEIKPSEPLLVVSGSCSENTARQIAFAQVHGFEIQDLDATKALHPAAWESEIRRIERNTIAALARGTNVVVCTARGPNDPAIAKFISALSSRQDQADKVHARIGNGLGQIVKAARISQKIRRAIFSGGDTSGHAMLAVGAEAMMAIGSMANGVPLLRLLSNDPHFDGMEVALKGGQMGDDALFLRAARGSLQA